MIPAPSWEEMICLLRGYHLQVGSGFGTDRSCQVWPDVCSTCGIRFERRPTAQYDGQVGDD